MKSGVVILHIQQRNKHSYRAVAKIGESTKSWKQKIGTGIRVAFIGHSFSPVRWSVAEFYGLVMGRRKLIATTRYRTCYSSSTISDSFQSQEQNSFRFDKPRYLIQQSPYTVLVVVPGTSRTASLNLLLVVLYYQYYYY